MAVKPEAPPGFRVKLAVLCEVHATEGGKRRFPPSLNAVKSEYKRFCEQ
jgi:hypothetical protein